MDILLTDIERAAAALVILAAIPVVTLALIAEYYLTSIDARTRENSDFDRSAELSRIRTISLCALIFQFALILGATEVRAAYPWLAPLVFTLAIVLQGAIQGRVEKSLRIAAVAPKDQVKQGLRFLSSIGIGGLLYMGTLAGAILGGSALGALLHVSDAARTVFVLMGGIIGLAGGIGVNFALGSFHVRRLFKTSALVDPVLFERIQVCFAKARLRMPDLWVIDFTSMRAASAMVAGFQTGRGWFRPGLFITRSALALLSDDELEAVVLHEVSHLSLNHLRSRLLFASGLILATTITGAFFVMLAQLLLPGSPATWILGPAMGFFSFIVTFKLLGDQSQFHELEADIHSIEKLGGDLTLLASSLRKLDRINRGEAKGLGPSGHPETERRLLLLRHYFARKAKLQNPEAQKSDDEQKAA